ncbi:MAG: alpha/beta hydrolase [Ignavibacteriae bacterium]|nr:alpha/beta hydrolase [Ignavibacteriota bacterium]
MKTTAVLLLLLPAHLCAQQLTIPRDTSFTLAITAAKIAKDYPHARAVYPKLPKDVMAQANIVYAMYGNRTLTLDLFSPSKAQTVFPAVVLIHGGGWRSGDKSQNVPIAQQLAAHGYVAATIEYRLSLEAQYPAAVHDIKAAIRWLRANATRYRIDPTKIAVMGFSAGGHLAALVGATNGNSRFEGSGGNAGLSSNVQAIVDIDGVLDFTHPAESGKDTVAGKPSVGAQWLGATYKEKPEVWIDASPLTHAGASTPPTTFINSSHDRFHAGRDEFNAKLTAFGTYAEVHAIPNTPHPFWLFDPWFEPTCKFTIAFLDKVFKTK